MSLPTDAAARKDVPIATGVVDYFPLALASIAELSRLGNEQHNPGQPLHWDRSKSKDEADALMRHFVERGTFDTDNVRHSTKVAWRALALLQKEIEASNAAFAAESAPVMPRVKWCVPCGAPVHNQFCERDWAGTYAAKKIFHHVIRRI